MPNLIGNLVELRGRPVVPQPLEASPEAIRRAFVPTRDAIRVCARILRRFGSPASPKRPVLLAGPPGSGRSHILRCVELLLADPQGPVWDEFPALASLDARPPQPVGTLQIRMPDGPHIDLAAFLCAGLSGEPTGPAPSDPGDLGYLLDNAAQRHASSGTGMIVLEGLSSRILECRDPAAFDKERDTIREIAAACSRAGVVAVIVADEEHVRRPGPFNLSSLRESCDTVAVSRNNMLEVVAAVAAKNDEQRRAVREVLEDLRRRFPMLGSKSDDFVDLYPVHSSTFDAMFRVRSVLPSFSPMHFIQSAIRDSLDSPVWSMITPDRLFDHVEAELRLSRSCRRAICGYDDCIQNSLPALTPALRASATILLKDLLIGSVRNRRGIPVRTLAHQSLLQDDTGALSGYGLVAAVMARMEELGGSTLAAGGEGIERAYRFCLPTTVAGENSNVPLRHADRLRLNFPLMLFDWIRSEVPGWNPEAGARHTHASQSIRVPLPDFDPPVRGSVCFKSPDDPLWSDEEIVALRAAGASWALLILSPFERAVGLEERLQDMTKTWDRILVWRPGSLTAREVRRLQRAIPAYDLPVRSSPARRARARASARRAIAALYLSKGVFRSSSDRWPIAEDVAATGLSLCLSRSLASLLGTDVSILAGSAAVASAGEPDRKQRALRWAALMPGPEVLSDPDPETAEQNLLAWWAGRLEVDCPALVTRLHSLPESMLTTRMWDEIKILEGSLGLMRSVFQSLRMRETSLLDALRQIAHHFGNDEARIARWRVALDRLAGMSRWLPAFEHAHDYLRGAFQTGDRAVDDRRESLIEASRQPHHFLESAQRDTFDSEFVEFKSGYVSAYAAMHSDVLGRIQSKVDPSSLRTLELLSTLPQVDATEWQKVKLIGRWAQRNRCDLPVAEILDRYPRCYCNFNPAVRQHLQDPGAQINRLVAEGIDKFRALMRNARKAIIEGLERLGAGEEAGRQAAALISSGPLIPVGPECIEMLGRIIQENPDPFRRYPQRRNVRPSRSEGAGPSGSGRSRTGTGSAAPPSGRALP